MATPPLRLVEELFDQAADLDPDQRLAFLDEKCGDDTELRAAVDRLLRLDATAPGAELLLRSPVSAARPGGGGPSSPSLPSVARYRAVRVLGEGGMGTVYEAEQDNPRRTVALKVIRPGLASDGLLRRFAREAQILGRLHHPGIAQIYEAGFADNGQPYLVMELVAGVPLDRYATEQNLDTRGRMELAARVCDAVRHAHERGIIHRDLKPGNILVEASGQPKVLDFGVARATGAGLSAVGGHTEAGQLIGTLSYMSPEQAAADPSAVDARSDIYALGVILYELLARRLPYVLDGLPLPEAALVIREQEPQKLGTYNGLLRGDIETIVAKAMEKDRTRRYATVGELVEDIRRYLNHQPIQARPPSAFYQLHKFTRRHKALVGGALSVMLTLVAGTLVSLLYAVRAEENARTAGENARQAHYQAYRARLSAAATALSYHDVADAARQLDETPVELRGWEWYHLHTRLDDSTTVFTSPPNTQLFPRDSSGFRVVGQVGDALVARDEAGETINSVPVRGVSGGRPHLLFPEDSAWLAAEIIDRRGGVIRVWDATGVERLVRLLPGHRGADKTFFSPDGRRLAVLQSDHSVSLFATTNGQQTAHCPRGEGNFNALALSRDGKRLAVATDSPLVAVWDADTGQRVVELSTVSTRVTGVAFHPREDRLLTASPNGAVQQWDLRSGREAEATYERHNGEVWAIAYSPDGQRVASAGEDRTVRLWRANGRQDEAILHGHTRTVGVVAFSRDGQHLASYDSGGTVRIWDTGPGAALPMLRGHTNYVYPVAYTPEGRFIASGSWDGTVRLWSANTGEEVASLPQGGRVRALSIHADGTKLVTRGDDSDGLGIWDLATRRQVASIQTTEKRTWTVAFRPNSPHLAVLGSGTTLEILDTVTADRIASLDLGKLDPWAVRRSLAYSPDGRLLAGPYEKHHIGLWETETYRLVGTLDPEGGQVLSVAFSADGKRLASAGSDSLIRVWDVATRECRLKLRGHADDVFTAVFHPDGTRLASGGRDRLVRLWDATTGEELVRLPGHSSYVYSLAFSPDGKTLVSSSGDGTLRLWGTEPAASRGRAR